MHINNKGNNSTHFLPQPLTLLHDLTAHKWPKKDTPFHCLIARIMPLMSTAQTLAENRATPQPPDCSCGKFPPPERLLFQGGRRHSSSAQEQLNCTVNFPYPNKRII